MARRPTVGEGKAPLDVRVVALPEGVTALIEDLVARVRAVEAREAELRETVARLEERIEALQEARPGMLLGAGAPALRPGAESAEEETQVVGMRDLANRLASDVFESQPEDSAFSLDNVEIDLAGSPGLEGERATFGISPRRAATGETATRVKFSLRRKTRTKVVE